MTRLTMELELGEILLCRCGAEIHGPLTRATLLLLPDGSVYETLCEGCAANESGAAKEKR